MKIETDLNKLDSKTVQGYIDERKKAFEAQNQIYAPAKKEGRAMTSEESEQYERAGTDFSKYNDVIEAWNERQAHKKRELELQARQGSLENEVRDFSNKEQEEAEMRALDAFFRKGENGLNEEERKILRAAQTVTTTGGGYTIPRGFSNILTEAKLQFGGIRNFATIINTATGNTIDWPTINDTGNSGRLLAINTASTETAMVFAQKQLEAYKYSSDHVTVPEELMQDSAFNLPQFILRKLAERLERKTDVDFTVGDGSAKPNGVVNAASSGVTANATGAITIDEYIDLQHSVDRSYQANAMWGFNSNTLAAIRKLTVGSGDARPLWVPSVREGEPDRFLGKPYFITEAMADIATSATPVIYGDMKTFYVRDVATPRVKQLTDGDFGLADQTAFVMFSRHDSELIDGGGGSIKKITMAAS